MEQVIEYNRTNMGIETPYDLRINDIRRLYFAAAQYPLTSWLTGYDVVADMVRVPYLTHHNASNYDHRMEIDYDDTHYHPFNLTETEIREITDFWAHEAESRLEFEANFE